MIYKNAQIGNTKNITLIELGNGDVKVAYVYSKKNKYTGIEFVNDIPQKIGTKQGIPGVTTNDTKPEAMLTFTDVKSIEIVEEALKKAKIVLINM